MLSSLRRQESRFYIKKWTAPHGCGPLNVYDIDSSVRLWRSYFTGIAGAHSLAESFDIRADTIAEQPT